MKNKSIIVLATLMLFTACSNKNTVIKKEPKVNKVPSPMVEVVEDIMPIVVEEIMPPGSNGSGVLPFSSLNGKDSKR